MELPSGGSPSFPGALLCALSHALARALACAPMCVETPRTLRPRKAKPLGWRLAGPASPRARELTALHLPHGLRGHGSCPGSLPVTTLTFTPGVRSQRREASLPGHLSHVAALGAPVVGAQCVWVLYLPSLHTCLSVSGTWHGRCTSCVSCAGGENPAGFSARSRGCERSVQCSGFPETGLASPPHFRGLPACTECRDRHTFLSGRRARGEWGQARQYSRRKRTMAGPTSPALGRERRSQGT